MGEESCEDAQLAHLCRTRLAVHLGVLIMEASAATCVAQWNFDATVDVDGERFFAGPAGCVLVGNMGQLTGGIEAFPEAKPDDGTLEVGIITADSSLDWTRALTRTVMGEAAQSPFVKITQGKKIEIKTDRKLLYELDGGDREKTKKLKIRINPERIRVKVPVPGPR